MPAAESHGVGSEQDSPKETQSIWFSPSSKSTGAAVHTVKSDGRVKNLTDGRFKLETVASPSEAIPKQFRLASVTKCSHKPESQSETTDEIDLLKFIDTKTSVYVTDTKPDSEAGDRFVVDDEGEDEDDDDDSMSIISEKTEKEADVDISTTIVNSSDLFSDPEDDEWCRNTRRGLLLKDESLVSVTDLQEELDSFISKLASEEIMLTLDGKVDPSFESITENNRKVLLLSSCQGNVNIKAEKKNASVENEIFKDLDKNDLFENKQVSTISLVSSPGTMSYTNKADNQDHPLFDIKEPFLLKEINNLTSKSQVVQENVLVTCGNHLTSCKGLNKKWDSVDFLQKADSESDFFKESKPLKTQQKRQSSVRSDSLSHLVSEEFALTGISNDLEAEITASAAYNKVFLSDLDENLSLSEICGKQNWDDHNVVDKEHSASTIMANLHEKIDLQLVKKQLGIGTKVSSKTIPPTYHNNAVPKKIVLQKVLKSNEDRMENSDKASRIKLFPSSHVAKNEGLPTEGFYEDDYKRSFYGTDNHAFRDQAHLESLACANTLETVSLTEHMDLTDFGHGMGAPLVSNILTSKELDSEVESWNVVERHVSLPSSSSTNSEEYQTIVADVGETLHQFDRGFTTGGRQKKTIPTKQLRSQHQGDCHFSDKHLKHGGVSSMVDRQAMSSQHCRSESKEKFLVQGSTSSSAIDQQPFLQPALYRVALATENDDTGDVDDVQTSGSMKLNKGTIFVGHKVPERVGLHLNTAIEHIIEFEMVSADDWLHDAEVEIVTAKLCNVAGAFLSATSNSVQICLASLSVPLTGRFYASSKLL